MLSIRLNISRCPSRFTFHVSRITHHASSPVSVPTPTVALATSVIIHPIYFCRNPPNSDTVKNGMHYARSELTNRFMRYGRCLTAIGFLIGIFCLPAFAQDYQLVLNDAFSGSSPASPNTSWMDVVFRDVSPGIVSVTVSNLNLAGTENVDQLYLNLNPAFDPLKLQFTFVSSSGGFDLPSITRGTNAFQADGDGKYDVLFSFTHNSNDKHQFTQGEYFTYDISGISGLDAGDFDCLSLPAGGAGPFYAAAHVQRIGNGSLSGWISATETELLVPVPEPSILGLTVLGATIYIRRRSKGLS